MHTAVCLMILIMLCDVMISVFRLENITDRPPAWRTKRERRNSFACKIIIIIAIIHLITNNPDGRTSLRMTMIDKRRECYGRPNLCRAGVTRNSCTTLQRVWTIEGQFETVIRDKRFIFIPDVSVDLITSD